MDRNDGLQAAVCIMKQVDALMGIEGGMIEHDASGWLQLDTNVTKWPGFRDRFPFGQ
jgi:hypothetical protein